MQAVAVYDFGPSFQQKRISVPSDAGFMPTGIRHQKVRFGLYEIGRQRRGALAKAFVGFLQCHDIGIETCDYTRNAMRIAPAVKADAFAYIPCCDAELIHASVCSI